MKLLVFLTLLTSCRLTLSEHQMWKDLLVDIMLTSSSFSLQKEINLTATTPLYGEIYNPLTQNYYPYCIDLVKENSVNYIRFFNASVSLGECFGKPVLQFKSPETLSLMKEKNTVEISYTDDNGKAFFSVPLFNIKAHHKYERYDTLSSV